MRKNSFLIICLVAACCFISHSREAKGEHPGSGIVRYEVDPGKTFQIIDNFGASDGWSMQYIGLWPEAKQAQMADWLFSTGFDEQGNPRGIGLSLWRFNIGAGSREQGAASGIDDEWRRSECFLLPDGQYDWSRQAGQRHFLKLARERGVKQFLGFALSAPVYWTQNGLATNTGRGGTFNLKSDKYKDYVRFLADVVQGLETSDGIRFDYICPFNEPDGHWNWTGSGQEGTAATKYEVARTVRLLSAELIRRQLNTKILIPESFDYNCMYRTHRYTRHDRGYLIQSLFSPDSADAYLGNLPNVPWLMAAHSYWTNTPLSDLRNIRKEMGEVLTRQRVRFWQTETCIMSNDEELGGGEGKDLTMKTALYVARIIHHDLVYANASAWHWWRAVANTDYKDGLIYTNPAPGNLDGTFTDSKLLWTLGNYSRFIRPGAVRVSVTAFNAQGQPVSEGETNPLDLMISAYRNTNGEPVVVVLHYGNQDKSINMTWKGDLISAWKPYLTSDSPDKNLTSEPEISNGTPWRIPARSIITYIGRRIP